MLATIKLFEVLKTRFSDEDAKFVVEQIEKIEAGVEAKVDKEIERKSKLFKDDIRSLKEYMDHVFASKEDMATLRIEMERGFKDNLKWTVGTIIACAAIIITLFKLL
ncbi:MAG: hypothetical protein WCH34_09120 [Bacteroidota bacterium]